MMTIDSNDDDDPGSRPPTPHQKTVRALSDRIVAAQRPLRILPAIHWGEAVEAAFFAAGARELPPVTTDTYLANPLPFDPAAKTEELRAIERDVDHRLGRGDPSADLLRRRCEEYREVVGLLTARGTPAFAAISSRLFQTAATTLETRAVTALFAALAPGDPTRPENLRKIFDAPEAVRILADRLRPVIPPDCRIRVTLCDRIVADAAAGCGYVKLRRRAVFSVLDLALLEFHEGWVHLGTTLNGLRQPVLTALAKGPPSTAATQEGLAVLCELLAGVCHAGRLARLWRRTQAVRMAEAGADFLQVYRHFLKFTDEPGDSYQQAVRVFRGSLPAGCGPFAKDLCYALGLSRVLAALSPAAAAGHDDAMLLFSGKTAIAELGTLGRLHEARLVARPGIVPPPFLDRRALAQRLTALHPPAGSYVSDTRSSLPRPLVTGPTP
jgi:uncharacterized protein (TIGR02421 family)